MSLDPPVWALKHVIKFLGSCGARRRRRRRRTCHEECWHRAIIAALARVPASEKHKFTQISHKKTRPTTDTKFIATPSANVTSHVTQRAAISHVTQSTAVAAAAAAADAAELRRSCTCRICMHDRQTLKHPRVHKTEHHIRNVPVTVTVHSTTKHRMTGHRAPPCQNKWRDQIPAGAVTTRKPQALITPP